MTNDIKRRKDGSIDTDHYIGHARHDRSVAFHAAMRRAPSPQKRGAGAAILPVFVVGLLLATVPFFV